MDTNGLTPVHVTGITALRGFVQFRRDPIAAMRAAYSTYGPFIIVASPFRFGSHRRPVALTAGARFNREVLSNAAWQPAHVMAVGRKDSAQRRVGLGIFSMRDRRHAHYRRLFNPPLTRSRVDSMGDEMGRLVEEAVDRWPVGRPFDLWQHSRDLIRSVTIGLLFADDRERGYPIADLVDERIRFKWSLGALACPVNLSATPYGSMVRQSEEIERRIISWAGCKRGRLDDGDLLSILVNNADENGNPPTEATIVGHVPSLFVAGYDTCRTALIWTLVLLAQHPHVARQLADELEELRGGRPSLEKVRNLPLLDAVTKESMRILPPVPAQIRSARQATSLGDYAFPKRSRVVLSAFVTNRLPHLYPEPDCFKPERWTTINPSVFEYATFSGGPRSCPGQWFGLSMLKVALAAILTRYRVALKPNARIDYEVQPTLSPRSAVPAMLQSNKDAFSSAPLYGKLSRLIQFPL